MRNKAFRILFTSIGRRVELVQEFVAAGDELGIELEIHGADISNTAPALCFCNRTVLVPRINDSQYIPFLLEYCEKNKIDALIPTIDTDLLVLSQSKAMFRKVGTIVFISDEEKIGICRDKRLTGDFFNSVGLLSPKPTDDYTNYMFGFPAFIKPKDGSSSIFAYKINDQTELELYSKRVPDYIVQKYIEGTEYTVDVFCDIEGEPIYITPRIRLAVRSGEVLKTKIAQEEKIINEVRCLVSNYKPCGPITIQLIQEKKTGDNYYIEINPRFGGGAPLSMKAGANSAVALLKLLCGETMGYVPMAAEDGAVFCRYDQSVRVN